MDQTQMVSLLFKEHGYEEEYLRGGYLFQQGDMDDQVFMVRSGLVKIIRNDLEGHEQTISIRTHGDLIGLAEVFLNRPRQCSAIVVNDAMVSRISGTTFKQLLRKNPQFSLYINEILSYRLRHAEDKLFSIGVNNVADRFCKLLLYFGEKYPVKSTQGIKIDLKLTHQEWATIVGTSRQTITKLMNDLKKEKVILVERKYIHIIDMNELKNHVPKH